jgi:SAM-dependent methyltransferase
MGQVTALEKTVSFQAVFESTDMANRQQILGVLSPQPGCSLLDCGCADGTFSLQVGQRLQATRVSGVEMMPELADICASKQIEVSTRDLNEGLDFPSSSFDVVLGNQVLEHLIETDLFVKEVLRVLKPGGYTTQSTNNLASWHNIMALVLGLQPMPCHASNEVRQLGNRLSPHYHSRYPHRGRVHWRVFASAALRDLFEYHGFESVNIRPAGYYPFPPRLAALIARMDKRHSAYSILTAYKPLAA